MKLLDYLFGKQEPSKLAALDSPCCLECAAIRNEFDYLKAETRGQITAIRNLIVNLRDQIEKPDALERATHHAQGLAIEALSEKISRVRARLDRLDGTKKKRRRDHP